MPVPESLRDILVAAVARDAGAPARFNILGNATTSAALSARAAALHAVGIRPGEHIAVEADFLTLGGDPVAAARIRGRREREPSIARFLERTTFASMAVAVAQTPSAPRGVRRDAFGGGPPTAPERAA